MTDNKVILLLEDEFLIALELAEMLEDAGFLVRAFPTVRETVAWLGSATPAAAVLDYRSGDETCEPVAELLHERHVPFAIYSGLPIEGDLIGEVLAGATWLGKPSPNELILETVIALTRKPD